MAIDNPARRLRNASHAELRARIVAGHPVDPTSIAGWAYRGTSLGLPKVVEALTWKTFQKTFHRDPATGRLLGWNVRLEQDGVDGPRRPQPAGGERGCVRGHPGNQPPRGAAPPGRAPPRRAGRRAPAASRSASGTTKSSSPAACRCPAASIAG